MPSYELRNGQEKVEIVRFKKDNANATYKSFEDAKAAAIQEQDECLAQYAPVSVKDTKYWALKGRKAMLEECTEETCQILIDEDAPHQMPGFPDPEKQ